METRISDAAAHRPQPIVSVIMSVYNGERFLGEAIDSVLCQTITDFELIIVDDGSTDSTAKILEEYAQKDPRIVVLTQSNSGIPTSLNKAIAAAKTDLIAHVDADDRALPTWLEEQLKFLKAHPDTSIVSSFAYLVNSQGNRIGRSQNPIDVERGKKELRPDLFLDVIHSTVLMKKTALLDVGGYRADCPYLEDRELWGRLVTAGHMIRCNPKFLADYRVHSGSVTVKKRAPHEIYVGRGINLNIVRRLQGKEELDYEGVKAWLANRPLIERIQEARRIQSGFYYKASARHYAERRMVRFAWTLGLAIAIRPVYVIQRVMQKANPGVSPAVE